MEMAAVKKWEILHIPGKLPTPTHQQPTVDVVASEVEPKLANTLLRQLNQIAPLENLRHVKRLRKNSGEGGKIQLSIILCLALANENQLESIPNNVLDLVNAYQLRPFITKVAKCAASSKEEWQEQSKLWPTSHHPHSYKFSNIDGVNGFSEEDSLSIFKFMKMAIKLAKSAPQVVNAAVIADPSVRQVIACACDQTRSRHAPTDNNKLEVGCIKQDIVASSSASAVEKNDTSASRKIDGHKTQSHTGVSCLYPWTWSEQQLYIGNSCSWHPLRHAAFVAIEYAAARDRRLFPGSVHSQDYSIQVDHLSPSPTSSLAKRPKIDTSKDEDGKSLKACSNGFDSELVRPYLCTGFDIYLVWEPCIMCSMALIHQRIRRVFYAFPNPNCGALGSVHRLQGEKSLNHHYAVFRVVLPEEELDEEAGTAA